MDTFEARFGAGAPCLHNLHPGDAGTLAGCIWLCPWHGSMVAWSITILIGQAAANSVLNAQQRFALLR